MADIAVDASGLAGAIDAIATGFGRDVGEQARRDVDAAAKVGLEKVEEGAARHVDRGRYAKSWRADPDDGPLGGHAVVIHSTVPGLPHLLDKGHVNRDGSFYEGDGHVAAAGEAAVAELERRIHG